MRRCAGAIAMHGLWALWFTLSSMGFPGGALNSTTQAGTSTNAASPGSQCGCSLQKRLAGNCCRARHRRTYASSRVGLGRVDLQTSSLPIDVTPWEQMGLAGYPQAGQSSQRNQQLPLQVPLQVRRGIQQLAGLFGGDVPISIRGDGSTLQLRAWILRDVLLIESFAEDHFCVATMQSVASASPSADRLARHAAASAAVIVLISRSLPKCASSRSYVCLSNLGLDGSVRSLQSIAVRLTQKTTAKISSGLADELDSRTAVDRRGHWDRDSPTFRRTAADRSSDRRQC